MQYTQTRLVAADDDDNVSVSVSVKKLKLTRLMASGVYSSSNRRGFL